MHRRPFEGRHLVTFVFYSYYLLSGCLQCGCLHSGRHWVCSPSDPNYKAGARAVQLAYNTTPDFTREGCSIPITITFEVWVHLCLVSRCSQSVTWCWFVTVFLVKVSCCRQDPVLYLLFIPLCNSFLFGLLGCMIFIDSGDSVNDVMPHFILPPYTSLPSPECIPVLLS